MSVNKRT